MCAKSSFVFIFHVFVSWSILIALIYPIEEHNDKGKVFIHYYLVKHFPSAVMEHCKLANKLLNTLKVNLFNLLASEDRVQIGTYNLVDLVVVI